jgi:hypothetical protein
MERRPTIPATRAEKRREGDRRAADFSNAEARTLIVACAGVVVVGVGRGIIVEYDGSGQGPRALI